MGLQAQLLDMLSRLSVELSWDDELGQVGAVLGLVVVESPFGAQLEQGQGSLPAIQGQYAHGDLPAWDICLDEELGIFALDGRAGRDQLFGGAHDVHPHAGALVHRLDHTGIAYYLSDALAPGRPGAPAIGQPAGRG